MMKISLLLAVASDTNFLLGRPEVNQFKLLFDSLQKQDFPKEEFELIISDGKYHLRQTEIAKLSMDYKFKIKHVPQSPNFFYDNGYYAVANAFNKALVQATGEICIPFGDGHEFYQTDSLTKYWNWWHKDRYLAMGMFYYFDKNGSMWPNTKKQIRKEAEWSTRDSRYFYLEKRSADLWVHKEGGIFYGLNAFPTIDGVLIGGFNELFDGQHGGEDNEFGIRLMNYHSDFNFVLDGNLNVAVHLSNDAHSYLKNLDCKSNHTLCMLAIKKKLTKANFEKMSKEHLDWCCTRSPLNIDYHKWKKDDVNFKTWLDNQHIFSLFEQWKEMQNFD
jgi:hypothetical protein